jgi:DivIVA domain-containing protein
LDRDDIERRDFPTVRRGYDPAAVDAHLRKVADELDRLGQPAPAPPSSLAAGASEQVRTILEAAEAGAAQLRAGAGEEARGHVERVEVAANEMVARLGRLQGELDRLLEALKTSAGVLSEGLLDLRARVEEMGGTVEVPEPVDVSHAEHRASAESPASDQQPSADEQPVAEEEPAAEEPAAEEPSTARSTDEEGARLAALELALSGRPREEAERYLAEHFELADPAALLDDVYTRIGR